MPNCGCCTVQWQLFFFFLFFSPSDSRSIRARASSSRRNVIPARLEQHLSSQPVPALTVSFLASSRRISALISLPKMLIKESFADVPTVADGKKSSMSLSSLANGRLCCREQESSSERGRPNRNQSAGIFLFHPTIPGYPNA